MADVKKILPTKPVEVKVESHGQIYFVTVFKNGALKIRPKGARNPEAVAITSADSIYRRTMIAAAHDVKKTFRRNVAVQRGLLATERKGF